MVAYCGWDPTLVVDDETVTLDGNGTPLLALPSLYVTAVSAVTVTDRMGTVCTLTVGPGLTDCGWSTNGCLTRKSGLLAAVWPEDRQNVSVTYSGGYETAPDDLAAAIASLSKRTAGTVAATRKMGTATLTVAAQVAAGGLLMVEQMVFDRYRIPRAA